MSIYYVSGTVLGTCDLLANETDKYSCPHKAPILAGRQTKIINILNKIII